MYVKTPFSQIIEAHVLHSTQQSLHTLRNHSVIMQSCESVIQAQECVGIESCLQYYCLSIYRSPSRYCIIINH